MFTDQKYIIQIFYWTRKYVTKQLQLIHSIIIRFWIQETVVERIKICWKMYLQR